MRCEAKVLSSDKGLVLFSLRAWDEGELIARGTHRRQVVEASRIAARVRRKVEQSCEAKS